VFGYKTCMTFFFLHNSEIYILKNVCNQTVSISTDFRYMDKNRMEVSGNQNCLVTSILKNIYL